MLYDVILNEAVSVGVGIVSPERIDEINILNATYEAMREAINNLTVKPIYYLTMQLQYRVLTLNKYLLSRVMQKVFQLQVPV